MYIGQVIWGSIQTWTVEKSIHYNYLLGLWIGVNQCPVYHAGYLGHNRVWDLAAKAPVSTSHQHHDLQSLSLFSFLFHFQFLVFTFKLTFYFPLGHHSLGPSCQGSSQNQSLTPRPPITFTFFSLYFLLVHSHLHFFVLTFNFVLGRHGQRPGSQG